MESINDSSSHENPSSEKPTDESYADLIQAIVTEYNAKRYTYTLKNSETGAKIAHLSRLEQAALAMALLRQFDRHRIEKYDGLTTPRADLLLDVLLLLLKRKLPFTADEVLEFLASCRQAEYHSWWRGTAQIKNLVQNYLKNNPLSPELQNSIEQTCDSMADWLYERKYVNQLRQLISSHQKTLVILPGETWTDLAIQQLEALSEAERSPWLQLLDACANISGSKPTAKWLKATHSHRQTIGIETFNQSLLEWLSLVDFPPSPSLSDGQSDGQGEAEAIDPQNADSLPDGQGYLLYQHAVDVLTEQQIQAYRNYEQNTDILKGLVWLCADQTDADLARALNKLAIHAYRKIPGIGPHCVKLGNACVWSLGQMPTPDAIAQLALLKVKVKFGTAQKGIEKALTAAAEREGLPREEIEELSVPDYGLTAVGIRRDTLGNFTAELVVTGTSSTVLKWIKSDGKLQKSVPKAVKDAHAGDLKALKQAAKEIQKMLPAQRDRIESLYLQQKVWDFTTWQERYLNHPLVGTLARRMLWQFESGPEAEQKYHAVGIWLDGHLVNLEGYPIEWLNDSTLVSLWHPIVASAETVQAWRAWLLEHHIQQPFKQAHREIYLLTAAEESTRIYSNRFAAHILKQHQFNALCGQRGWKNQLRLMVDDAYNPPMLLLPQWGLRAEFWIESIGDNYGTDTTDTGTYLYIATDQVRFYPLDSAGNYAHAGGGGYYPGRYDLYDGEISPVPLQEIPALAFSEVMRDVDLFVGVASVGNDPNWADGGPEGHHYDYWQSYSFGELSATAKTRRQVLEMLIPKLKKIRDRCSFQDRFLAVKGDIRTYKIHLGSGNILMTPNDQYLCIVTNPGAGAANKVFLPFEGDKTLSIILSKAFLLADDTHITDPTIVSQIKR